MEPSPFWIYTETWYGIIFRTRLFSLSKSGFQELLRRNLAVDVLGILLAVSYEVFLFRGNLMQLAFSELRGAITFELGIIIQDQRVHGLNLIPKLISSVGHILHAAFDSLLVGELQLTERSPTPLVCRIYFLFKLINGSLQLIDLRLVARTCLL